MHVRWYFFTFDSYFYVGKGLSCPCNITSYNLVAWFQLLTILTTKGSQCTLIGLMSLQNTTLKRFVVSVGAWNLYKSTLFKLIFSLRILVEMLVKATKIAHPLTPSLGLVASNLKFIHSSFEAFVAHWGKMTFGKWAQAHFPTLVMDAEVVTTLTTAADEVGLCEGHANILDTHSEGNLGETRQNHIQICSVLGLQQP